MKRYKFTLENAAGATRQIFSSGFSLTAAMEKAYQFGIMFASDKFKDFEILS